MFKILLPVSLLLASCTYTGTCEVPLTKLGPSLKESVLAGFRQHVIDYEITDDGTVCISHDDVQRASIVLASSVQSLLPRETSQSMDAEIHRRVVMHLKNKNISFSEQQLDDHNYLVWNSSDDAQVRQIIDEEFSKHSSERLGQ